MESNWRMNVWETGWSNSSIELVARLDPPLLGFEYLGTETRSDGRVSLLGNADMTGWVGTWVLYEVHLTTPFPFGHSVEPD